MTDASEEAKIREERMALENATPRPWSLGPLQDRVYGPDGADIMLMWAEDQEISVDHANAALIVAAVNSYDPSREEKVRALIKVATKSLAVMRECGWQIATASEPQGDGVLQAAAVECHDELDAALKALEE